MDYNSPLVGDRTGRSHPPKLQRNTIIKLYQCELRSTPSSSLHSLMAAQAELDMFHDIPSSYRDTSSPYQPDGQSSEVRMMSASHEPKDMLSERPRSNVPQPAVDLPRESFGPTVQHQNFQIDSPSKLPKELLVTP